MNAITPINAQASENAWNDATTAVNAWRGLCLHYFTQAEDAVTETLLLLNTISLQGGAVGKTRLPHLVGQRFEDLANAIGETGQFAEQGKKVRAVLSDFREHDALRVHICHGLGKVALERNGQWILLLRHQTLRDGEVQRNDLVFDQQEAKQRAERLRLHSQKLTTALRVFRQTLEGDKASSTP